jgi:hypothetical protein
VPLLVVIEPVEVLPLVVVVPAPPLALPPPQPTADIAARVPKLKTPRTSFTTRIGLSFYAFVKPRHLTQRAASFQAAST